MIRLLLIVLLFHCLTFCTSKKSRVQQAEVREYPRSTNSSLLPKQLHVIGIIREVSPGYCGIYCQGGYLKVELTHNISDYNYKSVFLITACLALNTKASTKVDVIATLHTGKEEECYYESFERPKNLNDLIFYKLSEAETQKIPHQTDIVHGSF